MPITPDEIENRVFTLVRRGYEPSEVDAFLREVATALAQAQGGLATPAAPAPVATPAPELAAATPVGGDDFGRLGDEVAAILRQAHDSVAQLRHRAEADAALVREVANRDTAQIRASAQVDRDEAAQALQAAHAEAAQVRAELAREREQATQLVVAQAQERARLVIDEARGGAHDALTAQRDVRGRLQEARAEIDRALERLVDDDEDPFAAIDLTEAAEDARRRTAEASFPPPGQGPPSPPVAPPPRPGVGVEDLPYAAEDDTGVGEATADEPVLDLTDDATVDEAGLDAAEVPAVTFDESAGADPGPATDAAADAETSAEAGAEDAAPEESTDGPDPHDDPLAQMVKNAVENALRRRKGQDPEG